MNLYCKFCDLTCIKANPIMFWSCPVCKTNFRFDQNKTVFIKFRSEIKKKFVYVITLYPEDNRTTVHCYKQRPGELTYDIPEVLLDVKQILNITPKNFQDKLKNLLLFS